MRTTIKILVVDDHGLVRDSLSRVLEGESDLQVVGTASNAEEGVAAVQEFSPDIVLMDIDMPGLICFDAALRIATRRPPTRVIFLSAFFNDHYIEEALRVKARGYLTKAEPLTNVVAAVRQVAAGKVYFSEEVKSRIIADRSQVRLSQPGRSRTSALSPREVQVLRYLARGMSKKQIARTMHLSVKTVEGHSDKLMYKVDIHDRVELARYAIREGLADA